MQLKLIKGKFYHSKFCVNVVIKLNLPYYASRPYSASIPRFILICGIRVLSLFAGSASGIRFRIPVPRFIPTPVVWRQTNYILYFN